ncbi:uncharacterized protein LOC113493021 isoform X2 [Trichoplusia ni]|uniref:Uncharacterized protein LOC113493021 isoform X2 n=1 Tax=Trichoplusia ni TaxID=7111 RepID=A0A7E5VE79_TRINI|nr:uncharacterized protein LOC113493021 isoform X2 [Trichoplusia ni]
MKKRTLSKLKSIFGSKKGKKQLQQEQSSKSSRSPSPEPAGAASPVPGINGESFRPILRTPPPSRAGPPPSPPVPTHPVAPVAPEPAAPLPLMPCAVCGRTFVPQSLAKHVKICEKMTVKKRKTFDSSRQRREGLTAANGANSGTDLEQYLPKNFGLPENSPFLEKSPPNTAKPTPKPKPQSVRNAITKPMAELQRCPHCNRAFGVRAFERHVEWCADKAKILPAAPAQPPQHIADAKQRLNARTQYKAPPVRGRRSSQTRDKSTNSRSASVDSSRGVSPPPPREYGDYRHGRARASESVSSNDCHEESSPHMPVIRNSRNSQNSSSGDANVKARQARLARDLSSSRKKQDPSRISSAQQSNTDTNIKKASRLSSVQESNTDPNIKKNAILNKQKNKLLAKKQQQLKKLQEIASKYSQQNQESKEDKKSLKSARDKSQIPVPKKSSGKKAIKEIDIDRLIEEDINEMVSPNLVSDKIKITPTKTPSEASPNNKHKPEKKVRIKTKTVKIVKETSMSLDSLEECPPTTRSDRTCQSIGINTELLCVPCVIHDNPDQKKRKEESSKKHKSSNKEKKSHKDLEVLNVAEPKVELLYKNPIIVSSSEKQIKEKYERNSYAKLDLINSIFDSSIVTPSTSGNLASDEIESTTDFTNQEFREGKFNLNIHFDEEIEMSNPSISEVNKHSSRDKIDEDIHRLSEERFEHNYEHDISAELSNESLANKFEQNNPESKELECRHGSGETYTKFIEDPADLDEFMSLTDKLLSNEQAERDNACMAKDVDDFHTPKTNSIEAINRQISEEVLPELPKQQYSDTFEELKRNLQDLLVGAGSGESKDLKNPDENEESKSDKNSPDNNRSICDMEHITVYELKFYDRKPDEKPLEVETPRFKLPSIMESNKQGNKVECNKKRMQKLYKPNRKYKMLGEQTRKNKEYQTFIVKENLNDNSDGQSVSSDAPPLKLPRIENKSSNNIGSESLFPSSVKRSTSLLDSIQKKNTVKMDSGKFRHKSDQLEQDIMQSLKDFDKFYENEKNENLSIKEVSNHNGTAKRDTRAKTERKVKKNENVTNGNYTPNGKPSNSNDSAYSSLNRISPSKLSLCTSKEPNGLTSLEQIPAGSESSGSHKEDVRSISSDEFLAMERSAELEEPLPPPEVTFKEQDNHITEKRVSSRASSRRSGSWRAAGSLSSSGSEASLHRRSAPRLSRFCHECGNKFPVDTAKFCIECGVKRLVV